MKYISVPFIELRDCRQPHSFAVTTLAQLFLECLTALSVGGVDGFTQLSTEHISWPIKFFLQQAFNCYILRKCRFYLLTSDVLFQQAFSCYALRICRFYLLASEVLFQQAFNCYALRKCRFYILTSEVLFQQTFNCYILRKFRLYLLASEVIFSRPLTAMH